MPLTQGTFDSPNWPTCTEDECIGIQATEQSQRCLEHLSSEELRIFLDRLHPGDPLDASGTRISPQLLRQVLNSLTNEHGYRQLGDVHFDMATFTDNPSGLDLDVNEPILFDQVQFTGIASFSRAEFWTDGWFAASRFHGHASFSETRFKAGATFNFAKFDGGVSFFKAHFDNLAEFDDVEFGKYADFKQAEFMRRAFFSADIHGTRFFGRATFESARIHGEADFTKAEFTDSVSFKGACFDEDALFDEASFQSTVEFDRAEFAGQVSFASGFSSKSSEAERGVRFASHSSFENVQFRGDAFFNGAEMVDASFNGSKFERDVFYHGVTFTRARFERVSFGSEAGFAAQFKGDAHFDRSDFSGKADFHSAVFHGALYLAGAHFHDFADLRANYRTFAEFYGSKFEDRAIFEKATFEGYPAFDAVEFNDWAIFDDVLFKKHVTFERTRFNSDASFKNTILAEGASFKGAEFCGGGYIGPIISNEELVLSRAAITAPTVIEASVTRLLCSQSRFLARTVLRVHEGEIAIEDAEISAPSSLIGLGRTTDTAHQGANERSPLNYETLPESLPRLVSLRGSDVGNLTISDIDLQSCLFTGAHHLDKLRIEGYGSRFALAPTVVRLGKVAGKGLPVWRRTSRQVLGEEHHLRAQKRRQPSGLSRGRMSAIISPGQAGWYPQSCRPPEWLKAGSPPTEEVVASIYRSLRKAREDNKDEPGAADFYYGEMEMRRLASVTPWSERIVLTLYWLLAGYGLRGLRAVTSLIFIVIGFAALFHTFGFSRHPSPESFWGGVLYAIRGSVSLPDDEARLTAWGKLIQVALRLIGPLLLGLALLAVRNRVKR